MTTLTAHTTPAPATPTATISAASPVTSRPGAAREHPPRLPRPGRRDRARRVLVGEVLLDQVEAHPSNIRRNLGDLRDLVDSIASYGVMHPVVLEDLGHGRLRVRAGHRRVAAARLAGLTRIPAVVHPDVLDDDEWLVHAAHENTRRRDLDRTDTLHTYQLMLTAGITREAAAAALGRSTHTLAVWAAWAGNGKGQITRRTGARVPRAALTRLVEDFRTRPAATTLELLTALDGLLASTLTTTEAEIAGTAAVADQSRRAA